MKDKPNDIDFLGRTLFLFLFALFIFVFSDNPEKQEINQNRHELVSDLHSVSKATLNENLRIPSFHKTWISSIDRLHFRLADRNLKIIADNNRITQKLISLEKDQFLTEPIAACQLYYRFFPDDSMELPPLS
ncbi:MAG: hypothetical protein JW830_14530 [Bacteroidales bacterium]|nr:hypothetical protein [Bacteroidales bacterium]